MIDNAVYSPEDADITFLGINYYGTCGEKGNGPELIREILNMLSSYDPESGKDVFDEVKMCDLGDVKGDDFEKIRSEVKNKLSKLKNMLIMMGGEHLVTLPVFEELSKKEKLNFLVFDAHADYFNKYNGRKNSYATLTRRVSELADKVIIAGVRDIALEEAEDLKKASNVKILPINEVLKNMEGKNWYISIDLDVLDPIYCPEVSTPVPLGDSLKDLVKVLNEACLRHNIVALDVVELTAKKKGLSSVTAGGIIMNYLKGGVNKW